MEFDREAIRSQRKLCRQRNDWPNYTTQLRRPRWGTLSMLQGRGQATPAFRSMLRLLFVGGVMPGSTPTRVRTIAAIPKFLAQPSPET
jgi:hypothetical protein